MTTQHTQDAHCQPFLNGGEQCSECGVDHGHLCPDCGMRGFHAATCPDQVPSAVRAECRALADAAQLTRVPHEDRGARYFITAAAHDAYLPGGYDFEFESEVCLPVRVRCHRDSEGNLEIVGIDCKGFSKETSRLICAGMPHKEDAILKEEMEAEHKRIEAE